MATASRAALYPETRVPVLKDWELRQSIATCGLITPVFRYRGDVLDGGRRMYVCRVLRVQLRFTDCDDRIEAARYLWAVHPRRAFERFADPKARPISLAQLFGCSPLDIPTQEQARQSVRRLPPTKGTDQQVLPRIVVPREVLQKAHRACKSHDTTVTAMIRDLVHRMAES